MLAAILCRLLVFLGWVALNLGWLGLALLILAAAYVIGGYTRGGTDDPISRERTGCRPADDCRRFRTAGLGLWRREYYLLIDGAVLILIFAISGALEGYAMQRTERNIRPHERDCRYSTVVTGQEQVVPIAQLQIGAQVLVKPGELIPTDGLIIEGYSTLNQASITGESMPVEKTVGNEVLLAQSMAMEP